MLALMEDGVEFHPKWMVVLKGGRNGVSKIPKF